MTGILPRLFTEEEAASALRVHKETLGRFRRAGKIGHVRVGGKVYYRESDLILYIEAGAHPARAADTKEKPRR